jgi:hypothetical protein
MWFQRSFVVMHGTSSFGVSFARALHAADDTALALLGTNRPAATHSGISHAGSSRNLMLFGMKVSSPELLDGAAGLSPARRGGSYDDRSKKQADNSASFAGRRVLALRRASTP